MSMSKELLNYDTILFDFDGVLVEPTDDSVFLQADKKAFNELVESSSSDLFHIQAKHGTGEERAETVRKVFTDSYDIDPDEYWERREWEAFQYQKMLMWNRIKEPYPEVTDVLSEISKHFKTGIVSNNQDRTVHWAVEFFGWDGHFEMYRGRTPTTNGLCRQKPKPDYLKEIAEELKSEVGLYVGDKETDLVAAKAAGFNSVLLQRPEIEMSLEHTEPDFVISNLAEILELLGLASR